ncbi:ejaculatory bulb-specific protein 3 [Diachasma alloeum]|uniref:Chemosensory protein 1 n=1 Tax=Diachasma alloeum TaxID=454923 RepID=A0A4E0RZ31_9HYME|nr:ejaculatory bulb-specific protein 3 [Diachasma alloeum]THK33131.1 chemosensory protein 1 [Diachasma alloeum]
MKSSVFFVLAILGAAFIAAEGGNRYADKYDSVNVDQLLGNERIYKQHLNCLLDQGQCSRQAQSLKDVLPEVLSTSCAKCSPVQRQMARKVVGYIQKNKPDDWKLLTTKFDPQGRYTEEIRRFILSNV